VPRLCGRGLAGSPAGMDDLPGTFVRQPERLNKIASVSWRYGFARLADHGQGIPQIALDVLKG